MGRVELLIDFKNGDIPMGLGIGTQRIDKFLTYKPNRFNVILARPNVGKTFWGLWYLLILAVKHGIGFTICSNENDEWVLEMYLQEFISGKPIKEMTEKEIYSNNNFISNYLHFMDVQGMNLREILQKSEKNEHKNLFIDPYNSLIGAGDHKEDYDNIRLIQRYKKKFGSVYLTIHPFSEAQRRTIKTADVFGADYVNYPDFMRYWDAEGGTKWFNSCDLFLSLHRFTNHPHDWMNTYGILEKEKVTQTGGSPTTIADIMQFRYRFNQFHINGYNPMDVKSKEVKELEDFLGAPINIDL
jgi:hypothetical protein